MSGLFTRPGRAVRLAVLGSSALVLAALAAYALLVLQPLASENKTMRTHVHGLAALSERASELGKQLGTLQREFDEETPSYRGLLQDLRGWPTEAHAYVSRIASDAGLEITAIEWTEAEKITPGFEIGSRRRWLRTGVFVRLSGVWRAHLDFAHNLSRCDCLVQVLEKKMTTSARPGVIESSVSLFIYHPGDGADV